MPSCSLAEFECLMSLGWLTSRCPCYPFPQQQRCKTFRSTSTSTEPSLNVRLSTNNSDSLLCASIMQESRGNSASTSVALESNQMIKPCISSTFIAAGTSSNSKAGKADCFQCTVAQQTMKKGTKRCQSKTGKALVSIKETLVPCTFLTPSYQQPDISVKHQLPVATSIGLFDLVEDQYLNFNPGYKSISPEEDTRPVFCCRNICSHQSDEVLPTVSVLNNLAEAFYEHLPTQLFQCQAICLGEVENKIAAAKRKPNNVFRASWAGPSTASASSASPFHLAEIDRETQNSNEKWFSCGTIHQTATFDESCNHCRVLLCKPHIEQLMPTVRSQVIPYSKSLCQSLLPATPTSSKETEAASGDCHVYWELEFSGEKNCAGSLKLESVLALDKMQRDEISVKEPPISRHIKRQLPCNCCHLPATKGLQSKPGKSERSNISPPTKHTPALPKRPYKLSQPKSSSDIKFEVKYLGHKKVNSTYTSEYQESRCPCHDTALKQDFHEVVTTPTRPDSRPSRQRCPTPPRVLSPSLTTISDIVQI